MARNPLLSIIMGRGRAGNALDKSGDKKRKKMERGERNQQLELDLGGYKSH